MALRYRSPAGFFNQPILVFPAPVPSRVDPASTPFAIDTYRLNRPAPDSPLRNSWRCADHQSPVFNLQNGKQLDEIAAAIRLAFLLAAAVFILQRTDQLVNIQMSPADCASAPVAATAEMHGEEQAFWSEALTEGLLRNGPIARFHIIRNVIARKLP